MRSGKIGPFKVSRLALGTVQFGMRYGFTPKLNQKAVDRILDACAKEGVTLLDTAREYGDSENKIGSYLRRRPKRRFVIATKLAKVSAEDARDAKKLHAALEASIGKSMKALGVRRLDLLQLHQPDDFLIMNPFFWRSVGELKEKGRFRVFGVSVYEPTTIDTLFQNGARIDFIQAPYNVLDRRFEPYWRTLKKRKVAFMARSTFLKGALTVSDTQLPLELESAKVSRRRLDAVGRQAGLSQAQLALLFSYTAKEVATTLVGVSSSLEMEMNIRTVKTKKLKRAVRKELERLKSPDGRLIDPRRWSLK